LNLTDDIHLYNLLFLIFGYNNDKLDYAISHIYRYKSSKTINLKAGYKSFPFKKYYGEYSYDLINKYVKYWLLGVNMSKKCYKYSISFKQNRIPILENSGVSFRKDNVVNLMVEFYPIGGVNQSFIFKGSK
jgi:LPS-assembly protein